MQTEETIAVRAGESFDSEKIALYLHEHITGIPAAPIFVRQFPAGASNLTYLLQIGNWESVLRRPPFGPVPPKAHDMEREFNLLRLIHPVFPLAPQPYLFCSDPNVMDVPFYVMERRRGVVFDRTFPAGVTVTPELCRDLSHTLVSTLVQIHALDWQTAGLGATSHPEGFLGRQVKSWIERYSRAQTDDIPQVASLTSWLLANIPVSPQPTLIHNDFKLNNMLLGADDPGKVAAVLDWEMATIGDPLFDLAVTLSYWVQFEDPPALQALLPTVTTHPNFPGRAYIIETYAQLSGRDLSSLHFYMTLAYFKLAVIIQQIYVRWRRGQTQDERFANFDTHVRTLVLHAASLAERGQL